MVITVLWVSVEWLPGTLSAGFDSHEAHSALETLRGASLRLGAQGRWGRMLAGTQPGGMGRLERAWPGATGQMDHHSKGPL